MVAVATRQERRRLAAILAADVVGYAALVAADEAGTLARLRRLFREAVQPLTAAHGGRIFRLLGDAVLAEFPSAVEALRCALALQEVTAERAKAEPDLEPIALRIGLALGDVVVDGGDLFGDGVNVAARLEALADPGGILVSAAVAEQANGRVACALEDLGPLTLKNLSRPVQAFRIRSPAQAPQGAPPGLPSRGPSLAVLPFANLSGDPGEDYFAQAITAELATALTRIRWFHVIAGNTVVDLKDRLGDLRQVGRELGVRYLLAGSTRRAGGRLRITGQLIEAETGRNIWADRFDGGVEDVFALQDSVAACVAGAIEPTLERAEIERVRTKPAGSLGAYDLYLQALPLRLRMTREDGEAALALLRRALVLDPGFGPAKAQMLDCHVERVAQGWAAPGERDAGAALARAALAAHGHDPYTLTSVAIALGSLAYDHDAALDAAMRAVALNPNSACVRNAAGVAHNWLGAPGTAIEHFRLAMLFSPHDADARYFHANLGYSHLMAGRPAEALGHGERALRQAPAMAGAHRVVIAAMVELDRLEEARIVARRLREFVPTARADADFHRLYRDQAFAGRLTRACRAAGLPP